MGRRCTRNHATVHQPDQLSDKQRDCSNDVVIRRVSGLLDRFDRVTDEADGMVGEVKDGDGQQLPVLVCLRFSSL